MKHIVLAAAVVSLIGSAQAVTLDVLTQAHGGLIEGVFRGDVCDEPPTFKKGSDGVVRQYYGGTSDLAAGRAYCNSIFVQMKIDGPLTNRYSATCRAWDRSGKLLSERSAMPSELGTTNAVSLSQPVENGPWIWYTNLNLENVDYREVVRVTCEANLIGSGPMPIGPSGNKR